MTKRHPDRQECLSMLAEYGTPDHVVRHCRAVTSAAMKIAAALTEKGFRFNMDLIQSAGLVHDIARVEDKHWEAGAEWARSKGWVKEAHIIARHMTHTFHTDLSKLTELDLVCLGDRLILEDRYVGIEARMQYVIDKAKGDTAIQTLIQEKKKISQKLIQNIEEAIGKSIEELMMNEKNGEDEYQ